MENDKINTEEIKSEEFARLFRIGEIIYPDLKKLISDILKEAGKFFSSGLYKRKYTPSTLLNTAEYAAPEYFTHLALFSRGGELLNFAQFEFPSVQPPNPPGNNA